MDIQKEIKISEETPAVFFSGTEMGELYLAMVKHWKMQGMNALDASLFYSLGWAHGIRQERARRKAAQLKTAPGKK